MWIYLYINRPKKRENVKNMTGIKAFKNVYYIYARSYQCSEWSSIVYNTQMTDVTGLENGSFSYVVTNQGLGKWVCKKTHWVLFLAMPKKQMKTYQTAEYNAILNFVYLYSL